MAGTNVSLLTIKTFWVKTKDLCDLHYTAARVQSQELSKKAQKNIKKRKGGDMNIRQGCSPY
jgi:hypothetical protein